MNGLSWLIYLADVAGSVKGLSLAVLIAVAAVSIGGFIAAGAANDHISWHGDDPSGEWKEKASKRANAWKSVAPYAITAAIIFSVFPSQSTIYAIAASEVGEQALKSETAGKAIQALNAWIDRQISPAPTAE